jgi:uncharacterized protein
MRYETLGKTGLRVSRVGFGGIPIQRLTETEAVSVVTGCLDLGITFIDTAHGYTTSEERIGKAIAGRRAELVIASKSHARRAVDARADIELSLRRLGTDWIDLYQLHGVNDQDTFVAVMAEDGAYSALLQAKREGLIRHIGFSSHSKAMAQQLVESGLFETLQYPFNFIANEAETELLPLVREQEMGFIAMKPLGGGLLPDARLALRYLLQFDGVVPDPGIQAIDEMREILSVVDDPVAVGADDAERIDTVRKELGTHFCHRCDYCQPCTQGIQISTVLSIRSNMRRFALDRVFGDQLAATVTKALDCIECGECEARCPYQLAIREMLDQEAKYYLAERTRYESAPAAYQPGPRR